MKRGPWIAIGALTLAFCASTVHAQYRTVGSATYLGYSPQHWNWSEDATLAVNKWLCGANDPIPGGLQYVSLVVGSPALYDNEATNIPDLADWLHFGVGVLAIHAHGSAFGVMIETFDEEWKAQNRAGVLAQAGYSGISSGTQTNQIGEPLYYFVEVQPSFVQQNYVDVRSLVILVGCKAGPNFAPAFTNRRVFLGYTKDVGDVVAAQELDETIGTIAHRSARGRSLGHGLEEAKSTYLNEGKPFDLRELATNERDWTVLNPSVLYTSPSKGSVLGPGQRLISLYFDAIMDRSGNPADYVTVEGPVSLAQNFATWNATGNILDLSVNVTGPGTIKVTLWSARPIDLEPGVRSDGGVALDGNKVSLLAGHAGESGYYPAGDSYEFFVCGLTRADCDESVDASTVSFGARSTNPGLNHVSWWTVSERSTSHYLLEREVNGTGEFQLARTVAPAGPAWHAYDDTASSSRYRLREVTTSGDTLFLNQDDVQELEWDSGPDVPQSEPEADSLRTAQYGVYPTPTGGQPAVPLEWVCFCPASWTTAAQPLANFWSSRGHPALVVSLESIGGAGGIRTYLQQHGSVHYALLAGDATDAGLWNDASLWSPNTSYVRPWPAVPNPSLNVLPMGRYVLQQGGPGTGVGGNFPYWSSDWTYGDVNIDGIPDVAVGRAPVRTASELTVFVQKTITAATVESGVPLDRVGVWTYARSNGVVDGTEAHVIGREYAGLIPQDRIVTELEDSDFAPMTSATRLAGAKSALTDGRGLVIVSGTSAAYWDWCYWLDRRTFRWTDTPGPWKVFPFVLGPACSIGSLDATEWTPCLFNGICGDPWRPLVETGLIDANRGPWGAFAPTRGGTQHAHAEVAKAFLAELYGPAGGGGGEVARRAVASVIGAMPELHDLAESYVFLGDPLVPIRTSVPPPQVSILGPGELAHAEQGTWTASPSSGNGTYDLDWFQRATDEDPWTWVASGVSYSRTMAGGDFQLRCDVTSSGKTGSSTKCVVKTGGTPSVSCTMTGPSTASCGAPSQWEAHATGGRSCGQYFYEWRLSTDGGATWGPIVGSQRVYVSELYYSVKIQVRATARITEQTAIASQQVYVDCWGGGCPTVEVLTSSGWAAENSILGRFSGAALGLDDYRLKATPLVENEVLRVRITESEAEQTTLDQMRMVAIDHSPADRAYAIGDRVLVGKRVRAHRVVRSGGADVTHLLGGASGGFLGQKGDTLVVEMRAAPGVDVTPGTASLTSDEEGGGGGDLIDDGGGKWPQPTSSGSGTYDARPANMDSVVLATTGILVQASDNGHDWTTIKHHYPREHADEAVLDTVSHDKLRLIFVGQHVLRYVGWIDTVGAGYTAQKCALISARHSSRGDITAELNTHGNLTTELVQSDTVSLAFRDPPLAAGAVRDCFLLTSGAYTGNLPAKARPALRPAVQRFAMRASGPNPFVGATQFRIELPIASQVSVEVLDAQGRHVRWLARGPLAAGVHEVAWDAKGDNGARLGPGVYWCRLQTGSYSQSARVILRR